MNFKKFFSDSSLTFDEFASIRGGRGMVGGGAAGYTISQYTKCEASSPSGHNHDCKDGGDKD